MNVEGLVKITVAKKESKMKKRLVKIITFLVMLIIITLPIAVMSTESKEDVDAKYQRSSAKYKKTHEEFTKQIEELRKIK